MSQVEGWRVFAVDADGGLAPPFGPLLIGEAAE
jgi:hypothetical protein